MEARGSGSVRRPRRRRRRLHKEARGYRWGWRRSAVMTRVVAILLLVMGSVPVAAATLFGVLMSARGIYTVGLELDPQAIAILRIIVCASVLCLGLGAYLLICIRISN